MKKNFRKGIQFILFLSLAIFMVYWVFKDVNLNHMMEEFKKAKLGWLFISFLMGLAAFISRALRWQLLFEPLGYKGKGLHSFTAVCVGYFANIAFPRAGEVARCTVINQLSPLPLASLIGTVVLERVIDLLMLILIMCIVILGSLNHFGSFFFDFFKSKFDGLYQSLSTLSTGKILILLLLVVVFSGLIFYLVYRSKHRIKKTGFFSKVVNFTREIRNGLKSLGRLKKKKEFILHTLFIWCMYIGMTYVCVFAYEPTNNLSLYDGTFLTVVGGFGMSAPVQGGFGAFHLIIEKALTLFNINPVFDAVTGEKLYSPGLVFATLVHTTQFLLTVVFGIVGLVLFYILKRKNTANG